MSKKRTTKDFEGFEELPYVDTKGNLTSGYGFNLDDPSIRSQLSKDYLAAIGGDTTKSPIMTKKMADPIFKNLYDNSIAEAKKFIGKDYDNTDEDAIEVTTDLFYNMGNTKLKKFTGYQKAIKAKDYDRAAEELKWYNPDKKKRLTGYWTDTKSRAKQHYKALKAIKAKILENELIKQLGGE